MKAQVAVLQDELEKRLADTSLTDANWKRNCAFPYEKKGVKGKKKTCAKDWMLRSRTNKKKRGE